MTSSPPNDAQRASERARWQAFAVCVAVAAITILDISKVNVGLPSIEVSLGAGPSQVQLIVAGYALAFGLTLVPSGRLGDIHSRKTMFLIGLAAFTIASVLCAVAPTIEFLLIGRIAQGFAAGIQMPQVLGLIQQLFQGKERSRAFGLFGGAVGAATAFGPSIGGLLIFLGGAHDGWRLLFWMNVPLGAIALVLAFRLLPGRQHHEKKRMELDLVGILLLGLATLALMLPFVLTTGNPSDDPRRWFWLVGGAAAAVAFVFWEKSYARRGKSPAVHFALFRHPSYRNGLLIVSAFYAGLPAAFLLIALYAQQGLHVPPLFAGLMTLPYTLIQAFVAWQSSRFI
ncbi:MAG: transporter, partial [Microbacteriaceae bacterium]|nr:transporter [Microbacteriaceae bacterium]